MHESGLGRWPETTPPDHGVSDENPLIIDIDASLTNAHSEKRTQRLSVASDSILCGRSSITGLSGTGECAASMLRPGNAGSNTAADHTHVLREAIAQLPGQTS